MFLSLPCLVGLVATAHAAPQVKIGKTTFTGRETGSNLHFFGGIPYAKPPIGDLRLQPPVLTTELGVATFDASKYGSACLQIASEFVPASTVSEDCLTINIYRPSGLASDAKLPVLFWTYGGAFEYGSSSTYVYNASTIVAQSVARGTPIIYVSYNYRLGALGFPQGQEAANRGALNLGLKDSVAALEWVQANIENFGGDKTKVTVFGESAGAVMTAILYFNVSLEKLARAAILESGSAASPSEFGASSQATVWPNFVSGVPSCASLATTNNTFDCLKEANSTEILAGLRQSVSKGVDSAGFVPIIDGPNGIIPADPSTLISKGKFARIPFIAGTNLDEGTQVASRANLTTQEIFKSFITGYSRSLISPDVLQQTVHKLLELYPDIPALGSPFNTGNNTFGLPSSYKREAAILGDVLFQSLRRAWMQAASQFGVKTFGYLFTQPQPTLDPSLGINHGTEVFSVYGIPIDKSASALHLSRVMIDYWVSFTTSLDPNDGHGNARPQWDQYTPQNQVLMELNADNTTLIPDNYREKQIAFINANPAAFRH